MVKRPYGYYASKRSESFPMMPHLPLDLDPDGSYQQAQEALRAAVEATAALTRLQPGMIATEALIAACIDQILAPENRRAFQAMLTRAEEEP